MFSRVFLCLFSSGDCRDRGNTECFQGESSSNIAHGNASIPMGLFLLIYWALARERAALLRVTREAYKLAISKCRDRGNAEHFRR